MLRHVRCAYCGTRLCEEHDDCWIDKPMPNEIYAVCEGCKDVLRDDEGITLESITIEELIDEYGLEYETDEPDPIGDEWDKAYEERFDEW